MVLLAMIPENPVVGGNVLRRAAIQSPNFVTGSTGWTIRQDGSAEFNNLVIRNGQIISGVALWYSASPALGNLIASVAAAGGVDNVGNAYLPGVVNYFNGPTPTAVQLSSGALRFNTAATFAGPWSLGTSIGVSLGADGIGQILNIIPQGAVANAITNITGVLNVSGAAASTFTGLNVTTGGASVTGGLTADTETISGSAAAAPLLQVTNAVSDSSPAVRVQVVNPVSQQLFFGGIVAGDTNSRLTLDVAAGGNPRVRFGPGNAGPDIILSRTAANTLSLVTSDFDISSIGRGLQIAEGTNARMGRAVLVAGAVTVNNTTVTAATEIFLTCQINSGIAGFLRVSGRVAGTSFSIVSSSGSDTSTVGWILVEPG